MEMGKKLYHYIVEIKGGKPLDCVLTDTLPTVDAQIKSKNGGESLSISVSKGNVGDKERFDWCVKQSFEDGAPYMGSILNVDRKYGFYIRRYDRVYDRYFSEAMKLEKYLSERVRKRYVGNELSSGKFYSVASSSRFVVSCFTEEKDGKLDYIESIRIGDEVEPITIDKETVEFEHSTPVEVISIPKLDFFFKAGKRTYFIEAKNHEILDNHESVKLSWSYTKAETFGELGLNKEIKKGNDGNISLKEGGKLLANHFGCKVKISHFDFEQFLCHLMGILSYHEEKDHQDEELYFYYLVYRNKRYEDEFDKEGKLYKALEEEVRVVFDVFSKRLSEKNINIHFGLCYHDKYDTLKELKTEFSFDGKLEEKKESR